MVSIITVSLLGICWMIGQLFSHNTEAPKWGVILTGIGLVFAAFSFKMHVPFPTTLFQFTPITLLFGGLAIGFTLLGLLQATSKNVIALMLFSTVGALMCLSWSHLIILFLGIEILSIPLYILAGSRSHVDSNSQEAALKYFIMGAFASCFLLLGIALFFAATGNTSLSIVTILSLGEPFPALAKAGLLFITCGLAFKAGLVPFHSWIPDVYEGSPTAITGWMAPLVKTAIFGSFLIVLIALTPLSPFLKPALWTLALLSMILGALSAARQTNIKRLLAFSGIANAGFIVLLLSPLSFSSIESVWMYVALYGLTFFGLFALLNHLPSPDIKGLWKTKKPVAAGLIIGLLSLSGIPPLPGFWGKWVLLAHTLPSLPSWINIITLSCIALGFYTYFKVILTLFSSTHDS
jgi:NADH-quinone oxidoreductase subunit N